MAIFHPLVRRWPVLLGALALACVPPGNAVPEDAGAVSNTGAPAFKPSINVMRAPFEDSFDRQPKPKAADVRADASTDAPVGDAAATTDAARLDGAARPPLKAPGKDGGDAAPLPAKAEPALAEAGGGDGAAADPATDLGPDWSQVGTTAWRIENGRLCGEGARNHGVWLNRTLPVNARIEFEAIATSPDGDLKAELWGDGRSAATSISYTNATSYLTIFGGWKNTFHVLARINEHGDDRKEIKIDPTSDDPRQKPVNVGQVYHFKVERKDGKTVRWSVDGVDFLSFEDATPLAGLGHDHFGFNNWQVKVCFDNVKVTPL